MRNNWLRLLPGLLFLVLAAYLGAALWGALHRLPEGSPAAAGDEPLLLRGIAVRRELVLDAAPEAFADGARLPAGTRLTEDLVAPCSVLVFSGRDGLEGLSPEDAAGWDVPALRALLDAQQPASSGTGGRVVTGFDWAFAALCPASAAPERGARVRLRFSGREETVSALVLSVSPPEDGLCAVVFRLTAGDDEYWKLRLCTAELIS